MQQLAHRRTDDHHRSFPACPQTLGERMHGGTLAAWLQWREVEGTTEAAIARFGQPWRVVYRAPRRPLTRRQTSIGCQLPGIDHGAYLLNLGEHPRGSPPTNSGNRAEQLLLTAQLGRLLHLLLGERYSSPLLFIQALRPRGVSDTVRPGML